MFIKRCIMTAFLFAAASTFGSTSVMALSDNTLLETLRSDKRLTKVVDSFTGSPVMEETLSNGENHYTLILPSDSSWQGEQNEKLLEQMNRIPSGERVSAAFDAFVIPGRINLNDVKLGTTVVLTSVGGEKIEITRFGSGDSDVVINNRNVEAMKTADNGFVYITSGVPVTLAGHSEPHDIAWIDRYISMGTY